MDKNLIDIIVRGRRDAGLKQSEVGEILGVKGNTISDWESGRTEPDIESFIQLCNIYGINAAEALNSVYKLNENDDFIATTAEARHIQKYRTLDDNGKEFVSLVLNREYDRCQSSAAQAHEERAEYNIVYLPYPDNRASAGA